MKIFGTGTLTDNIFKMLSEHDAPGERAVAAPYRIRLPLRYRYLHQKTQWITGRTVSVSENEVRVETDSILRLDAELDLEIEFSAIEKTRLIGQIYWSGVSPELQDRYESGVRLLNRLFIRSNLQERISRLLSRLPMNAERRHAERLSIHVPVKFKTVRNFFLRHSGSSLDLSENGMRLEAPFLMGVGTYVNLEFRTPDNNRMKVTGRVVWARRPADRECCECGVAFLKKSSATDRLTAFMAGKICNYIGQRAHKFDCRPVEDFEELQEAYRLVYHEYLKRGYCSENPSGMFYSHYALLPDSQTIVLRTKGKGTLLGTITLIGDSPCGLPMEGLFPGEIGPLRKTHRKLAEVGLLSLNQDVIGRRSFSLTNLEKTSCLFSLFKTLFDYARFVAGVTDLVMCMHPKHQSLYLYLGCRSIGPVRTYPDVCNKPALPMRLDIIGSMARTSLDPKDNFFLGSATAKSLLQRRWFLDTDQARRMLFEYRPLWTELSPKAKAFFEKSYHGIR